jgi:hypothetical protein
MLVGIGVAAVLALGAGGWFVLAPSQHAPVPQAPVPQAPVPQVPGQQAAGQQPAPAAGSVPTPAAPSESAVRSPPVQPVLPGAVPPATAPAAPPPAAVTQPTQTPPAPPPTTPPAPTQEASTDLNVLRQQLAQTLAQAPCTLANGLLQDSGAVSISGYAGSDAAPALRQQLAGLAAAAPLDWRVQPVDPVFCGALGALRPIAAQAGAPVSGLSLALAGGQTTLHDGERIMPRVTMGAFAGEVRVDYLGHDGSVVHLYPTAADPAQHVAARPSIRLTPGAQLSIGEGGPGRPIWEVGPPYGTDMIIVVASSAPVLTRAPAQNADDNAAPYLRDLANGIARVRQTGGQVAGTLLLVNTLPK